MNKLRFLIPFLVSFFLFCVEAKAAVIIDSVKTTESTCPNNGSMQIFAKSTSGFPLYAITNGPLTFPAQTNNTFASLPPGVYTVEVSNINNEKQQTIVTIIGNYKAPEFLPIANPPACPAINSGSIIGNVDQTTGLAPYSWELIPPSIETRSPQVTDTFKNLFQGTYFIRLTDACNNVQSKQVILFTPQISMNYFGAIATTTGCDTTQIQLIINVSSDVQPYKISYTAAGKNYTIDTVKFALSSGNILYPIFTAPNVTYGGTISNIVFTNGCGTQLNLPNIDLCPFRFLEQYRTITGGTNCGIGLLTTFGFDPSSNGLCIGAATKHPTTVTIKDAVTGDVVDSKVYTTMDNFESQVLLPQKSYDITFTDSCGNHFNDRFSTPAAKKEVDYSFNSVQTLLDSTTIAFVYARGFPTTGTILTVLDGPVNAHSTKPGYVYTEDYVYPKSFTGQLNSDSSMLYSMYNTAPGKYHFAVVDTCGNQFLDSFVITNNDVASFDRNYKYTKGCVGESGLLYEFKHNLLTGFSVTNINTGNLVYQLQPYQVYGANPFSGVVNNLTASDYALAIDYHGGDLQSSMNNIIIGTFIVHDTIHIDPYQNPSLRSNSSALCNGNLYLTLLADSTKGIPPYQYEIISGPQTFPPQSNNYFELSQAGNYRIRLTDKCGNSAVTDVTVNNSTFPPITGLENSCVNSNAVLTYGASSYFSYSWKKPNGNVFIGDTLIVAPITPADTGIYTITRITTINGCTSTATTTFHLPTGKTDSVTATVCNGSSYHFGAKNLTQAGIYRDTFSTAKCDSIVILTLNVNNNCVPQGVCNGATHVVWKDDFGHGTPVNGGVSTAINPSYHNQNSGVGPGNYAILNYFNGHPGLWHLVPQDHTPNDTGGYFLVMDGADNNFYTTRVDNLCPNTTYTFSAWTMNMDLPAYPSNPTFIFNVTDVSGNLIGQLTTPSTALSQKAAPTWVQTGFTFNTGANTSVKLNLILTSSGFNDFAFDDIEFSVCGPTLDLISTGSACSNKVDVKATLGSGYTNPVYQWYKQTNNNWVADLSSSTSTYTDNTPTANNWYKVTVRDGASACSFIEDSIYVPFTSTPLDTLRIDTTICTGQSVFGYTTTGVYPLSRVQGSNGCDSLQLILNLTANACTNLSCKGSIVLHGTDEGLLSGPETAYYSPNGFTWECWFNSDWYNNTDNTSHVGQSLLMSEDGVFCEDIVLAFGWPTYPRNSIGFGVDGPGQCGGRDYNPCYYVPPGGFQPNTWYHVAGVMDYANKNTKLYFNGQLVDTKINNQSPLIRNITTRIGTLPVQGDSAFKGRMDEIRIWNYSRSAAEINANYKQCLTGNETGLVAYYHFNEASGTIAHDVTPNHRDIVINPSIGWDKTMNAPLVNDCSNPSSSKIDTAICSGSYLGYNSTGTYIDTLINYLGCDSIRTLNLSVSLFKRDSVNWSICAGHSYLFGNRTLTQLGIYRDTFPTTTCDSISILNLTVNNLKKDSSTITRCGSYPFGNRMLTQTGIYRDTFPTSTCDSISVLNLTINNVKRDSNTVITCVSFPFGNRTLTKTGIYRDTISTTTCDSISILNLTINNIKRDSNTVTTCSSFLFGNRTLTKPGIYRDTIPTTTCDSISVLNLTISSAKRDSNTVTICTGQSQQFGNRLLSQQGIYRDTFSTGTCDSISILNLKVSNVVLDAKADKHTVTKGELVHLDVTPSNFNSYIWSANNSLSNAGIHNPTSIVNTASWYKVIVTDINNCSNSDSVFIQIIADTLIHSCTNTIIYIPTAFTPNTDGRNDLFKISGINNIAYTDYHLMIYNRWGNKVFESTAPSTYWDGNYKGQPAELGNYVYYLRFICEDGTVFTRKGNILLLR